MDFTIELIANSNDEGGFLASFTRQLAELGGIAELVSETMPHRVDLGESSYFEARRTYNISIV